MNMPLPSLLPDDEVTVETSGTIELVIERATLLKALAHVQSVVERRNTMAILSNVKLDCNNGQLTLTATDMDLAISETVQAEIKQAGIITTPAHMLYDIVRKLPDGGQVSMAVSKKDPGKMEVNCGNCKFSVPCLSANDFPVMDAEGLNHNFNLSVTELRALLDKTRFAMSTEETRYYLNGIYMHTPKNTESPVLRTVATDGHRLARMEVTLPEGAENIPGIIIPRKAVNEVKRLVEEGNESIAISLSATKIRFTYGNTILVSKLIDGTFPEYENVIPSGNDKLLSINSSAFTKAVDRVSIISSEKTSGIKLTLTQNNLVLSAGSDNNGSATEELEVTYDAGKLEVGFNSRYVLELMSVIEGENVDFTLADGASPAIVKDAACDGALYVIMPMRV